MKKFILLTLLFSQVFVFAQGMLENIDQNFSYLKLKKNGSTEQMKIFECHKNQCQSWIHNDAPICFNFNPTTEAEIKLFYRSGFNLLHQRLLNTIGELIAYYQPHTVLVGMSKNEEFTNIINTQVGNKLKMISTDVPAIIGATNWISKYNNIRFIGLFKEIMLRPVTNNIQTKNENGEISETYQDVAADLSCK